MDSNELRFPWEEPDEPASSDASPEHGAAHDDAALAGAPHTDVPAALPEADEREPWEPDADVPEHGGSAAGEAAWSGKQGTEGAPREADADRAAAARDRPIAHKEYYSISEVCDLVDLKPHVLRYWETQFAVLNPSKNRSGNRVYQRKEIKLIQLVKHLLYEEKYTVEGAKQKLDRMRRGGELPAATGQALERQTVDMLRSELRKLSELLTPPEPA